MTYLFLKDIKSESIKERLLKISTRTWVANLSENNSNTYSDEQAIIDLKSVIADARKERCYLAVVKYLTRSDDRQNRYLYSLFN